MQILKKIYFLSVLLFAFACSFAPFRNPDRSIALSDEEKPSHTFRFYGKQGYLPKTVRIYERKFHAPVELRLETEDPSKLSCLGYIGYSSEVSETYTLTASPHILNIDKKVSYVDCTYSGQAQHQDLKVSYQLIKVPVILVSPFAEKLKADQLLLQQLSESNWQIALIEIIKMHKLSKTIGGSIPATAELIKFPEVAEGDWVEFQEAQGIIQYGISQYTPEGTSSIPAADRIKLLYPDARAYALICGSKNKIMIEGKKNLAPYLNGGEFFCAINVKTKSFIKTSGSFGVKLSHVSKQSLKLVLEERIKQTEQQIAEWDAANQGQAEDNSANLKLLNQLVHQLAAKDAAYRFKEPATTCSSEISGESFTYKDIKRLVLGDVGKFCSSPSELAPGRYLTICDGDAITHHSGDFTIFDGTLKIISKVKLPATEERTTLSSVDKPLVRKDATGKNIDFVLATKDGRVLFYDLNGKLKKTLKIDFEYLESPILLPDGSMVLTGYETLMSDTQSLFYLNDKEVLAKIDLTSGTTFAGPYLLNGNVYVTSYEGQLLGFSPQKEKVVDEVIEKGERLSPPALLNESALVIGSGNGKLYSVDTLTGDKKLLHRANYTGETSYSFTSSKMEPLIPNIQFTPIVLNDGRIVFSTSGDGRVHMLEPDGKIAWQVHTPIVSGLLNFSRFPGTDYFLTGSISYMTIVRSDGHILARYSNSGAENPFIPLPIGKNRFLSGMYNGVFLFEMKTTGQNSATEIKQLCPEK